MDYKYIEQLMDRYWKCETSLEEEQILRTFFSQESVPVYLLPYKDLFTYEHYEVQDDRLGEDFDRKMLEMVGEKPPVKAREIRITQRLKPFFKAAAIVAVILTMGNAMKVAFQPKEVGNVTPQEKYKNDGISVAKADSINLIIKDSINNQKHVEKTLVK